MEELGFPHTMLSRRRVENIEFCLETILREKIPGDCMECGVWRGGAVILMRGYLAAHGITDRTVWVADSFEGIPAPTLPQENGLQLSKETHPMLAIDLDTVRNLFERYGLLDDQVRFLKGWFKDTLPQAPVERLALLRLDGDLYESTMDALEALYHKVVPGGFVVIDDYGCLEPCRRAVTEFRERYGITDPIHEVDWTAVYWRKSAGTSGPAISKDLTIFRYPCRCGETSLLGRGNGYVHCRQCMATYAASASGIIDFFGKKTDQNAYFDALYEAGRLHKNDELDNDTARSYASSYSRAQEYLTLCGIDPTRPVTGLSILDAACGAGWVTAGLLSNPMVRKCRFHAYDISPQGLEMLAKYVNTVHPDNVVEMSVQDANRMVFEDGTFDLVIGSSVLHHFDDIPSFLAKCRKILRPGGAAVFGEPFAIGYGMGVAALMAAQRQLGVQYPGIDAVHKDISYRIHHPNSVENLVDKHLFFQSSFLSMARRAGFSDVSYVSPSSREYYRDQFISDLMVERGVSDPALLARANEIYSAFFEVFDAENFGESLGAFVQVVLRA
jgi:ubiquinone/menaquinone biosynthesis C-methylase UbiE